MTPPPLSTWTPVKVAESGATADGIVVPRGAVGASDAGTLPAKLLIRPGRGPRVAKLVDVQWSEASERYVKADKTVFASIGARQHVEFPKAELKRLNRRDWIRHDREARANAILATAAALAAGWGIIAAAVPGAAWPKIVAAGIAVCLAILGGVLKWRARR